MPCDTVNSATVILGKVDSGLLKLAMDKLHPGYVYSVRGESIVIRGVNTYDVDVAAIKREISRQAVLRDAKRFGWKATEQPGGKIMLQKARQ